MPRALRGLQLAEALRAAIVEGRIEVAYQPLLDLRDGRVVSLEALARWRHPTLGDIAPQSFIGMAERHHLIGALSNLMLDRVCQQIASWRQRWPADRPLPHVHVNVSAVDVCSGSLPSRLGYALRRACLPASQLTIELTESGFAEHIDVACAALAEVRRMGARVQLDDFGSGYSSLSYLATLPVDGLKLDARFLVGLTPGSDQAEVVRAMLVLGAVLGKDVVAEGIETRAQRDQLREMGCVFGQGRYLHAPVDAAGAEALINAQAA